MIGSSDHHLNSQPTTPLKPHIPNHNLIINNQKRDASTIGAPLFEAQRASVYRVLGEIGTPRHLSRSVVEVWNKVDAMHGDVEREDALQRALFEARRAREQFQEQEQQQGEDAEDDDDDGKDGGGKFRKTAVVTVPPLVVPVSARTGEGLAALKAVIAERLVADGHVVPAAAARSTEGGGEE